MRRVVGTDTVDAGTGDDEIFADDGVPDFIDCGKGRDEVVSNTRGSKEHRP